MNISILGTGSWGTANAVLLANARHNVTVWGRTADSVEEIRRTRMNAKYLPGETLPESISWTADRATALKGVDIVVVAVPSRHFEEVCRSFSPYLPPEATVVSLTKGFCPKTHRRMTELAADVFGTKRVVALSGPSHAEEVVKGMPTAVTAASEDLFAARLVQTVWTGPSFRVYTSDDVVGVEAGGAVKNVLALAVGMSDGLGFGDNTRAALITRGLAEVMRFACALGGRHETLAGLSGTGDLIVTCTSSHSRNHTVGERLGRGERLDAIIASMQMVAEGVGNAQVVHEIAQDLGVEMPIAECVWRICYDGYPVKAALSDLMNRPMKGED
ncbi:MAG: NAD(P)H-dependent glycerol-3-phosphate dehydrogenase [bacterium]|nr:NAD(P)H-dependent glycerol-3-phosphate dehydrogenase [bacterium]